MPIILRLFILLPLLLLSACYRPVYGERPFGADATVQENRLNRIAVANIGDELGQQLRNFLIDRMYGAGRPDKTDATLSIGLSSVEEDLGLQKDATTLRKKVTYVASYTLTDNATQKVLLARSSRTFVSYDKIDAQYGVLVSKSASAERAMRELSDLVVTQLLVYYGQKDVLPPESLPQPNAQHMPDATLDKPSALKKPEPQSDAKDVLF